MAVDNFPWGDGSGDYFHLSHPSYSGNNTITITSDANTGWQERSKTVRIYSGSVEDTFTITQAAGRDPIPAEDGMIWVYYDVTTTDANTQILYSSNNSNLGGTMIVDGVGVNRSNNFIFSTTGLHLVKFMMLSNHTDIIASQFRGLGRAKQIFIPDHITSIANYAFYQTSWTYGVIFRGATPPSYGSNCLAGGFQIYVPYSSDHSILNAYKSAWSSVSSRINELNADGSLP